MAQVTVLSTKTMKKYTIEVNGNTLGALKSALGAIEVDYNGMTFFEGRTRTELLDDQSTFPDNAVIRLTKSEKKITSGIEFTSRPECVAFIKSNADAAAYIKTKEGKNWTNCGTAALLKRCTEFAKKTTKEVVAPVEAVVIPETKTVVKPSTGGNGTKAEWIKEGLAKGYITKAEATQLEKGIVVDDISAEDDDMFNFCKK